MMFVAVMVVDVGLVVVATSGLVVVVEVWCWKKGLMFVVVVGMVVAECWW